MPKSTITSVLVDNGPDDQHTNTLLIAWGPTGGAPESPKGWVNAGYAHVAISRDPHNGENPNDDHYVVLDAAAIDHLISTLRRVRRKAFRR